MAVVPDYESRVTVGPLIVEIPEYARAWEDYRGRAGLLLAVMLGGPVGVVVLGVGAVGEHGMTVAALLWVAGFVIAAGRLGNFRCPRCGEHFFRKPFVNNPLARKCMHCALPKGSKGSTPSREQWWRP